jgi:hypothetical protein
MFAREAAHCAIVSRFFLSKRHPNPGNIDGLRNVVRPLAAPELKKVL